MADENKNGLDNEAAQTEAQGPAIVVNAQYLRDLSFENPNAPASMSLMQQAQPEIGIDMNVRHRPLEGRTYESVLKIQANAKSGDTVLFMVECDYAAVVTLGEEVPEEAVHPILVVEVSRLIFPFARKIVSDAVQEGGFPPLMLNPIDFRQLLAKAPEEGAEETADA